jgi:AcrR family transcriptional regulator
MANAPDRTQLLIEAARSLFMEKGFAAVGMREITARAGLTPTQSYRLGLAKEDLLAEISIALTAVQLRTITPLMTAQPNEPLLAFVERYLLRLYESDIEHIRIRRESAAYGWMWSNKYEQRIVAQVMALLLPIADAMQSHGLEQLPARGFTIWSLYYVGYRAAVVAGADARQCVAGIRDSLALALRP